MSDDPTAPKGGLEYQVGMLAGQVNSILTSINLWQQGNQARDQRVETLERRLNTIEAQLKTLPIITGGVWSAARARAIAY